MTQDLAAQIARALIDRNQGVYEELLNKTAAMALSGIDTQPILHEAAMLVKQYKTQTP